MVNDKANRSLYLFLCSLMGALLFLIVHRTIMLVYYLVLNDHFDILSFGMTFRQIAMVDYATLVAAVLGGIWYGIWIGQYWYHIIYEHGYFNGVVHHIFHTGRQARHQDFEQLREHISALGQELGEDMLELENLTQEAEMTVAEEPVIKTVKKAAPKKRSPRPRIPKTI